MFFKLDSESVSKKSQERDIVEMKAGTEVLDTVFQTDVRRHEPSGGQAVVIQWVKRLIKQEITRQIYLASLAQHPTLSPPNQLDSSDLRQRHFKWTQNDANKDFRKLIMHHQQLKNLISSLSVTKHQASHERDFQSRKRLYNHKCLSIRSSVHLSMIKNQNPSTT